MLEEWIYTDDKELIRKICAYVKAFQKRPFAIEGYGKDITEKYWYFLHAHNILFIHNYDGFKAVTDPDRKNAIITKIEVNELLLEKLYGIKLD
jgi:hypothetical protein